MHTTRKTDYRTRRAFTLVELLVVIAIIVVLAAIGFSMGANAIKKAQMLADKRAASALFNAIETYYADYNVLPDVGGGKGGDTTTESDTKLMNILMAFGPDGEAKNPKGIRYYTGKTAKGSSAAKAYDGLFYSGGSSVELFDVWKKRSGKRHYQVVMDTNYDGEIADPIESGVIQYNIRALVWSTGADGQDNRGNPRDPKNRDNVYTWRSR